MKVYAVITKGFEPKRARQLATIVAIRLESLGFKRSDKKCPVSKPIYVDEN